MAAECLIFNVSAAMAIGVHQIMQGQWKKVRISVLAHLLMHTISFFRIIINDMVWHYFFCAVFFTLFLSLSISTCHS